MSFLHPEMYFSAILSFQGQIPTFHEIAVALIRNMRYKLK